MGDAAEDTFTLGIIMYSGFNVGIVYSAMRRVV